MIIRQIIIAVVSVGFALGASALWRSGFAAGERKYEGEVREIERRLQEAADELLRKEADRLALEHEQDRLIEELERQANEDPDADRQCLGADSVQRLRER